MTKVFDFKDYNLALTIAGEDFIIDCRDKGDVMTRLGEDGAKLSEDIKNGIKLSQDALKYCAEAINGLLGKGAAKRIFKDRKPTLSDYTDLLMFLAREIAAVIENGRK